MTTPASDLECAETAVRDRLSLMWHMGIEERGTTMMLELMGVPSAEHVTPNLLEGAGVILTHNLAALAQSELLVAVPELCGVLNVAATTFPDKTMFLSDMLTPFGMVWFADPIDDPVDDDAPDYTLPIRAISWAVSMPDDPLLTLVDRAKNRPVLTVIGYSDTTALYQKTADLPNHPSIYPVVSVLWELESADGGKLYNPQDQRLANFLRSPYVKLLMAFWAVMRQRLTVDEPPTVKIMPNQLKRAQRRNPKFNPAIHLVRLHRRVRTEYTGFHGFNRPDWQHSWVVRAHWRDQYYPSTGEHKPILIWSYIKGPADKELIGKDRAFLPPKEQPAP